MPEYLRKILNIEKDRKNPRKDYAKYSDVSPNIRFFFKEEWEKMVANPLPFKEGIDKAIVKQMLELAAKEMVFGTDENTWFSCVKELGGRLGFATSNKDYKENPEKFVGSLSDSAEIIRIAVTGSTQSPNLHEILEILGEEEVRSRLNAVAKTL